MITLTAILTVLAVAFISLRVHQYRAAKKRKQVFERVVFHPRYSNSGR